MGGVFGGLVGLLRGWVLLGVGGGLIGMNGGV